MHKKVVHKIKTGFILSLLVMAFSMIIPNFALAELLPSPIPPAGYDQYRSDIAHGTIRDVSYYSTVAGKNLTMIVYTPPYFDPANTSKKYGVVYCYQGIDIGPGAIFADWCCYAGNLCDNLVADGLLGDGVIIVALDDQFNGAYESDVRSMTLNDAIPYIDANYPTYQDADNRGIYGYSWGGGYTFNVGCASLDTFHHLGPSAAAPNKAGDTTLFPNGGAEAKQKLKTLLITWGQWDYDVIKNSNIAAVEYCNNNNIPHYSWEVAGEGHVWAVWRPALWHFLKLAYAQGIAGAPIPVDAFSRVEAENFNLQNGGVQSESCSDIDGGSNIGYIQDGSYVGYNIVNFGDGPLSFNARVASATNGGKIELYLDSLTGKQIGSVEVPATGGWQTWTTTSCTINNVTGTHKLYLKFTGESGYLFNVNWWQFGMLPGIDIGSPTLSGSDNYNHGVVSITAAGDDIWNTSDSFRFVNVSASGDFSITARVNSLENIDPWSKAGLMIRNSLNANASNAFLAISPDNGLTFQYRQANGNTTANIATGNLKCPIWLKLTRSGNTFTGYYSQQGTNWTQAGSTTLSTTDSLSVGLAVTSHQPTALCTAIFDNITAPNWITSDAPSGLTAIPNTNAITLQWNQSLNATAYNVKKADTSGGPYSVIASNITTNSFTDSDITQNTPYFYRVSKIVAGSESPVSREVSSALRTMNAYLKFDQTSGTSAVDSSGNNQNGTLVSGPTWTAGITDNCVRLDGSDDHITLPAGIVSSLTDFTISIWVKLDTVTSWSRVFDFGSGTSINMFLTPNSNTNSVRFAIKQSDSVGEQIINGTEPLPAGVWTHVAVTLNGTTGTLYVNGKAVGSNGGMTTTPASLGNTPNNYIGRSQYPDPYLDGLVDEFRIYPTALNADEIAALMTSDANYQPYFSANPINNSNALEVLEYAGDSIAPLAIDHDSTGQLTFSKLSGPLWLTIAPDGTMSGTPDDLDVGINNFTVAVTDNLGATGTADMTIQVLNTSSGANGIADLTDLASNWLASDYNTTPPCNQSDLDANQTVNLADFAILSNNWLKNNNLKFFYKFDQYFGSIANDSSPYNQPGQFIGNPTWTSGKSGNSLYFDGENDYVVNESFLGIDGTNPRTVSAFIRAEADLTNEDINLHCIVSWGSSLASSMAKWFISLDDGTGQLALGIYGARIKGGNSLEDGQWHHIAVVLPDGATNINQVKLYVDGQEVQTNAASLNATISTTLSEVTVGACNGSPTPGTFTPTQLFKGNIDDLRIYDKALTPTEIAELAQ